MTATTHHGTAKIIPFPKGGRSGPSDSQGSACPAESLLTSMRVAYVDYGSGAYHDAAIREEQRSREH